jgi:hypothetical protein
MFCTCAESLILRHNLLRLCQNNQVDPSELFDVCPPATALVHLRCTTFQYACRVYMRVFGLALLVINVTENYIIMIAELDREQRAMLG